MMIKGMDGENADCTELLDCTAAALDDEMLQILFVSAQQANLDLCVHYATER
jgi:hypothetical protein